MFIVNSKDGAYSSYYIGNLRFEHVSGGISIRIPDKIREALAILACISLSYGWRQDRC